jgi:hypothetical protein
MNREEADGHVYESQDFGNPKGIGSFSIDLAARKAAYEAEKRKKIEYEFQEVAMELEPIYGKRICTDFHRKSCTEAKIRRAHEICVKRGKSGNYPYFRGVLRKL